MCNIIISIFNGTKVLDYRMWNHFIIQSSYFTELLMIDFSHNYVIHDNLESTYSTNELIVGNDLYDSISSSNSKSNSVSKSTTIFINVIEFTPILDKSSSNTIGSIISFSILSFIIVKTICDIGKSNIITSNSINII